MSDTTKSILVVEDDDTQRGVLRDILESAAFKVQAASSARDGLAVLQADAVDLLLTDLRMPEMDGLELLREAKRIRPETEVVLMTAYSSVNTAVTAMKEGAVDYLAKPFDKEALLHVVGKVLENASIRKENTQLRKLVDKSTSMGNIIGECAAMEDAFDRVRRAVPIASTVLILGESGTGKEMVARHIHYNGPRKNKPFIVVNCAAIPDTLIESELFGHEKGAFTGAETSRPGRFEAADGGTIFLDEIGDMRLDSQAKLLRVLQDSVVERLGGTKSRTVDVRVIAATNQDLRKRVESGEFREDLFFRLEVLPIHLPPLRDRIDDLPLLVDHFRQKLADRLGKPVPTIGPDAFEAMRRYRWPGSVRELENTLEQLFILCDGDVVGEDDLPEKVRNRVPDTGDVALPPGGLVLDDMERDLIKQAIERSGGRIKDAAELLGLSYKTLQYRLKKHGIDRKEEARDTP
jgi:DNA-binding NtrC family response regulator